jgi:hypothetical protein
LLQLLHIAHVTTRWDSSNSYMNNKIIAYLICFKSNMLFFINSQSLLHLFMCDRLSIFIPLLFISKQLIWNLYFRLIAWCLGLFIYLVLIICDQSTGKEAFRKINSVCMFIIKYLSVRIILFVTVQRLPRAQYNFIAL